jgi:DNA gyrase subunit A
LLTARVASESHQIIIGTAAGMSIRFQVSDVRSMGRDSRGVRGINLREGDRVIGMDVISDEDRQVLCVSANGYGKRTPVSEWRMQTRGGLGIIAMDASDRNGEVVNLSLVAPDSQLMVITNGGQVIRTLVSQIREAGRNTQGVRVIRLSDGERVVDVAPVAERDDEETPPSGDEGGPSAPVESEPNGDDTNGVDGGGSGEGGDGNDGGEAA